MSQILQNSTISREDCEKLVLRVRSITYTILNFRLLKNQLWRLRFYPRLLSHQQQKASELAILCFQEQSISMTFRTRVFMWRILMMSTCSNKTNHQLLRYLFERSLDRISCNHSKGLIRRSKNEKLSEEFKAENFKGIL